MEGGEPQGTDGLSTTVPRLELRLLGEVSAVLDGERLDGLTSQRVQRVLAKLVLAAGRPQSRSKLAYELWPESTETQAHTNLRKVLHEIRASLPDAESYISIDSREVAWRDDAPAVVDVVTLSCAVERGDDDVTAASYGGDLLPACWDDWVLADRHRMRSEASMALDRLAAAALDRGDHFSAIEHATALVRLDRLWEAAYRHLMRAHASLGNRAEALRAYHQCAEVLEAELGVEPDAETLRVHEMLRGPTAVPASVEDQPTLSPTVLVGRDRELRALDDAWKRACGGEVCFVLVTGEPGIGKSRLVAEMARRVGPGGAVACSRAYEAVGRLPWGPVVDWLRAPQIDDSLGRLDPAWRAELAPLLPELAGAARHRPGRPGVVDPARRRQLFDAVAHALLHVDVPLLLVVDDLQWCDRDTIDLIGFLATARPAAPLLLAGTARIDEVDDDHPLTSLVAALAGQGVLREIALPRLDAARTTELARRVTGQELLPAVTERLWRDTEGNPLFVIESARAGFGGGRAGLTPTVKATIGARLGRLSEPARAAAEVAATIGRRFGTDVLLAAIDTDEREALDSLDELWRRRIVREHGPGYDFTHDKIREVAYEAISPARRRRHHGAVADALVMVHGDDSGPQSAAVAAHLELAGRVREAVDAHRHAAGHALSVCALDEAILSSRRGLGLLEQVAAGPARDDAELGLRLTLGAPLVAREGYGSSSAQEVYERALALCRRSGRTPDAAVLRGLGLGAVMACRFDRSARFGEQLLATAGDPVAPTEGHYLLGVSAFWRGDLPRARQHLEAALAAYRPELGGTHRSYFAQDPHPVCLVRLGLALLWQGHVDEVRDMVVRARDAADATGHPTTLGYVLMYTSIVAAETDDLELLRAEVERGAQIWAEQRLGYFVTLGELFDAWLGVLDGRTGALDQLDAAVDSWRAEHQSLHLTYGLAILARARLRAGDLDAGMAAVREGLAWGTDHDQRYAESLLLRIEGDLLAAAGDRAGADAALTRAVDVAADQGAGWLEATAADRLRDLRAGTGGGT